MLQGQSTHPLAISSASPTAIRQLQVAWACTSQHGIFPCCRHGVLANLYHTHLLWCSRHAGACMRFATVAGQRIQQLLQRGQQRLQHQGRVRHLWPHKAWRSLLQLAQSELQSAEMTAKHKVALNTLIAVCCTHSCNLCAGHNPLHRVRKQMSYSRGPMRAHLALVLAALLRVQDGALRRARRRPRPRRRCLPCRCCRSALLCAPVRGSSACPCGALLRPCIASRLGRPHGAAAAGLAACGGALLPSRLPCRLCLCLRLCSSCTRPTLRGRCRNIGRLACAGSAPARGSSALVQALSPSFCCLLLRLCVAVQHMLKCYMTFWLRPCHTPAALLAAS